MSRFARLGIASIVLGAFGSPLLLGCGGPTLGSCGWPQFCIWEDRDWSGDSWGPAAAVPDYNYWNWPGTDDDIDNEISSYLNRTGCRVRLHQDTNYAGQYSDIESGERAPYLEDDPNGDVGDNEASSHGVHC
jgi:hypothetical protein